MKKFYTHTTLLLLLTLFTAQSFAIESIQTPYTIMNVRNAQIAHKAVIVAGGYDGELLCYDYDGSLLWENKLSGFLNLDIYCGDIDGDQQDEVLAANADGTIYCIDNDGTLLWTFRKNDAPMSAVTIIHKEGTPYIVCGGYDKHIYYLDAQGNEVGSVYSKTYSRERSWGSDAPESLLHIANFLRPATLSDGSEVLVMHGAMHGMSTSGSIYLFEPLAQLPYKTVVPTIRCTNGAMRVVDATATEGAKVLLGTTAMNSEAGISELSLESDQPQIHYVRAHGKKKVDGFGYRVAQGELINDRSEPKLMMLYGRQMLLLEQDREPQHTEVLSCKYSFNDVIKDASGSKLIFASAQSGGNCIHIIDTNDKGWKKEFETLEPQGNIASIVSASLKIKSILQSYTNPTWEDDARPVVYFISDKGHNPFVEKYAKNVHANYPSPVFLNSTWVEDTQDPTTWNRDTMSNEFYRTRRDGRKKYQATAKEILDRIEPLYEGDSKGMSTWGGHGNDPFFYSPEVTKKMYEYTKEGQQTVLIFPEMEGLGSDVAWLMDNFMYPLADHARKYNGKLFIRSKNIFWAANVYEQHWNHLISGEYADVFVPSMEETSDKTMEVSLAGRLGVWCSGAVDSWGSRCARDNTSYNRLREHSHQMLPNHFLRNMIYHISYGAQYLDNFAVNQEYTSILWDMIAKGLLYVPTREQLVSLNPVRLTMLHPDSTFLQEGTETKWVTRFDQQHEDETPMVFSRMDGSWPAAPTTQWDFSRYAAGAHERRLNFISSYNNGLVMIAPPYDATAVRGDMESHLNPIYKGKTREFFTDGRYYYSDAAMTERYQADEYYKEVEQAIQEGEQMLPLTVKGEVGWVAAQSAPNHIRLTVIDGSYINPSQKEATIKIGSAKVKSITDLISGKQLIINNNECDITVPCGMFLFLDVELAQPL